MFKKMMALLLCAMMLITLVACGDKQPDNPDTPAGPKEEPCSWTESRMVVIYKEFNYEEYI